MLVLRQHPLLPHCDEENNELNHNYEVKRASCTPSINIVEAKELFRLEVAAPGLEKKDFNIDITTNRLKIKSNKTFDVKPSEKVLRREFCFDKFERTFSLPKTVDAGNIEASYKNGILIITLPKKEEAQERPPREIKVS